MRTKNVSALSAAVCAILFSLPLAAQDVAKVNSKSITMKLENDRVRVMEAVLKPGQKETLHSHPASIVYVMTGGTTRNHTPDGKVSDVTLKAGQTIYREPLTHWAENIGKTTMHLLIVELKGNH
jgi:quercetin dioxygenase-like cupin family protein